jgi:carbon-monoxide dehydrogenase medium subunit
MKSAPFSYHRATAVAEAVRLLDELGPGARVLGGGQSLLPLMHLRLAKPSHLVDINPVAELDYIRSDDGALAIGARTRQSTVERSAEAAAKLPLLVEAVTFIAHPPIRHRGTVGGSIAHADPSAELPTVLLALDGEVVATGPDGARTIPAGELFAGPQATTLRPNEVLTEVRLNTWPAQTGQAWVEFAPRRGSPAVVGVAASVQRDGASIARAAIALAGVAGTPVRARDAEQALVGNDPNDEAIEQAAEAAVAGLDPPGTVHGTADYKRRLARALVLRALRLALSRSGGAR